jgi:Flp pilus assembly protein TadD
VAKRKKAVGADPLAGLDPQLLAPLLGEPEPAVEEEALPPVEEGAPRETPTFESSADAVAWAQRLVRAGEWRPAREAYEAALAIDPASRVALVGLAGIHAARNDHHTAAKLLGQAQELAPEDPEVAILLGREHGRRTAYDEAEAALARALAIDPGSARARCERGILLAKRGLYAEAIGELTRGLEAEPGLARAHHWLGVCFNHLDRLDEAVEALERATQADPHDDRPHYHLGIVYDRKGRMDQARAAYRRARELAEARKHG